MVRVTAQAGHGRVRTVTVDSVPIGRKGPPGRLSVRRCVMLPLVLSPVVGTVRERRRRGGEAREHGDQCCGQAGGKGAEHGGNVARTAARCTQSAHPGARD